MPQMGEHFKKIRKELGKKQQEIADELGFHKEYIGKVERDEQQPSFNLVYSYYTTYGVSVDYILSGKGNMFILREDHFLNHLSEREIRIIGDIKKRYSKEEESLLWDSVESVLRFKNG